MRSTLHAAACAYLLSVCAGCSFVDPKAGASQVSCGIAANGQGPNGSSYYGSSSQSSATGTPMCTASPDNACDVCEATHCCATRSACYGDPTCACADQTLDDCLDFAATLATGDQAAQLSQCWSGFSAKGSAEQARVSCQTAWCQTACKIP